METNPESDPEAHPETHPEASPDAETPPSPESRDDWHRGPIMPKVMTGCAGVCLGIFIVIGAIGISKSSTVSGVELAMAALLIIPGSVLVFGLANSAWTRFRVDDKGVWRRSLLREKHVPWNEVKTLHVWNYSALSGTVNAGALFFLLGLLFTSLAKRFERKDPRPEDQIWEAALVGKSFWPAMKIPRAYPYEFIAALRQQAQAQGVKVLTTPR